MRLFILAPLLSCLMFTIISESSSLASETPTESYESSAKRLRVTPFSSTSSPSFSRHSEIDILPEELLITIFDQLNFRDLGAVQLVCRQWHRLGSDEMLSIARHIYKKPLSEVLWKLETIKESPARLNQEITALVSNEATGEKFFESPHAIHKLLLASKAVEYVLRAPSLIPLLFKSDVTASEIHHTLDRKTLDTDQQSALETFVKSGSNLSSTINLYSEECINFTKDFAPYYKALYLLYLFGSPIEKSMHEWFKSIYAHITSKDAYGAYSEDQAFFIPRSLVYFSDLPYSCTQALGVYCHRWAKKSREESLKNLWLKFAEKFFIKYIIQEDTQNQLNLGLVLQDQGKFEAAEFCLRNAANQETAEAQFKLGTFLSQRGKLEEGVDLIRKVADKGFTCAQSTLGRILFNQQKYEEAELYLRKAADKEDTSAQATLGKILFNQQKYEEAEVYLRKVADKGYTSAQTTLGRILFNQHKDEEAEVYLRKAADKGDTSAQITLGKLLSNQKKYEEAEIYSRKAADEEDTIAKVTLGQILFNQKKYEEAKSYLRKAANEGDTRAQVTLELILVNQHKDEEAEVYLRKAADKGDTSAQSRLGRILFNQKKYEETEFYSRKAADKGDIGAHTTLGVILSYQQKYEEAEVYLRKAAGREDTSAQSTLGVILFNQQKYEEAEVYLRKAADKEDTNAQFMLGKLLSLLKKA